MEKEVASVAFIPQSRMEHKTHSLYRAIMDRALGQLTLEGNILDLGGSRKSGYHELLRGNHAFTVVNIDEGYGYDLRFNVEEPFPLADASFDHVLCLNLLEHVYNYRNVLSESRRVLKPGGSMVSATPFAVPVHPCPHDYFRYTGEALRRIFAEAGFTVEEVRLLGCGALAVAYQNASWIVPFGFLRIGLRHVCAGIEGLLRKCSGRYERLARNYALGYLVIARKIR